MGRLSVARIHKPFLFPPPQPATHLVLAGIFKHFCIACACTHRINRTASHPCIIHTK